MEKWKPIPGYEGLYDASSMGKIRSLRNQKILKPKHPVKKMRQDGRVSLWKDGKVKDYLVARLVAVTWLGVPSEGFTVNHINGDWRDNRVENLEWLSLADNIRHGYGIGLYKRCQKPILLISHDGEDRLPFCSMVRASEWLGRCHGYVSECLKRGNKYARSLDGSKYRIVIDNGN